MIIWSKKDSKTANHEYLLIIITISNEDLRENFNMFYDNSWCKTFRHNREDKDDDNGETGLPFGPTETYLCRKIALKSETCFIEQYSVRNDHTPRT